jgi:excisionase family DNA binding protein
MERLDTSLLTPSEVALRLGVSRSWLYAAAKQGRIPCVRLGGDDGPVRFLEAELAAWLLRASPERSSGVRSADNKDRAPKDRSDRSTSRRDTLTEVRTVQQLSWSLTDHAEARPDRGGA